MRIENEGQNQNGSEAIDALIRQDAANAQLGAVYSETTDQNKHPRTGRHLLVGHRPSYHILDLRKEYLIEKYDLGTIAPPKKRELWKGLWGQVIRLLARRERHAWHFPHITSHAREQAVPELKAFDDESGTIGEGSKFFVRPAYGSAVFGLVLLIVIALVPAGSVYGFLIAQKNFFVANAAHAITDLTAGVLSLADRDFGVADEQLGAARAGFSELQQALQEYNSVLLTVAAASPVIGGQVTLSRHLGSIGEHSAAALELLSSSLSGAEADSVTDTLQHVSGHYQSVHADLVAIAPALERLDPSGLPPDIREHVVFLQNSLPEVLSHAERINQLLTLTHAMLGGDRYSRYLLLFQNTRELRATGGFIGSYALADVSKGALMGFEFPPAGTYDLSGAFKLRIAPPEPLSILNDRWFIWDANWWPDFQFSARKIAWFYEHSGGPTVDGVIAVNSDIVPELLGVYGSIELPEFDAVITEDNFYAVVQNEVELMYDKSKNEPKRILTELYPKLLNQIVENGNYLQLIELMSGWLSKKQIQIALFSDAGAARVLEDLGWSGSLRDTTGDYLHIVSTNIAGGKSDASIYQSVDHQALIDENGAITVRLTLTKQHQATPEDVFAYVNNVDYLRFYVPEGSVLLGVNGFEAPPDELFRKSGDGFMVDADLAKTIISTDNAGGMDVYQEHGKTVFADWMQVEPGDTSTVSLTYRLPFTIDIDRAAPSGFNNLLPGYREVSPYSLLVQKQSGKHNFVFRSTVIMPETYSIIWNGAVQGAEHGAANNLFTFSAPLDGDVSYALLLALNHGV